MNDQNRQPCRQNHRVVTLGTYTKKDQLSPELHLQVGFQISSWSDELNIGAITDDPFLIFQFLVVLTVDVGESPFLGDDDLLTTRELVACPSESLGDDGCVGVFCTDGEDDLADVDTGYSAIWFTPCPSHTGLQTISASAGQHLVDANDVEGMYANAEMERVFARGLGHVFVGADTSSFERF